MTTKIKLEQYRQGYPRLAAFLGLDPNFTIFARFSSLHIRTLLEQQDRLYELQQQLEECDDTETIQLNLSSRRQDENVRRREILRQITAELRNYDKDILRFHQMLALPRAREEHCRSIFNWVNGNKPVVKSESATFLEGLTAEEYIALDVGDSDRAGFEHLLDQLVQLYPRIANSFFLCRSKSSDDNIFLLSRGLYRRLINCFVAFMVPMTIICPALLLYNFEDHRGRAAISAVFVILTSFTICFMTNVSKYELLLAVVTYAAILSAFLSGP